MPSPGLYTITTKSSRTIVHSAILIVNPFLSPCNKRDGKKSHSNYKAFTINKTIHL